MYQVEGTVPSVVLDVGSHTVKAGLSGVDLPHVLTSSSLTCAARERGRCQDVAAHVSEQDRDSVSYSVADSALAFSKRPQKNVDVVSPFGDDGLVENWAQFEALVGQTLHSEMQVETSEHAILYAEPNHNGRVARERLVELFFEKFNVPAAYLAKSAVLAAYASGRTTGLVLDLGHSGVSAVPVLEGALVKDKGIRTSVGGRAVSEALKSQLAGDGFRIQPLWAFKRTLKRGSDGTVEGSSAIPLLVPSVAESYERFANMRILEEIKAGLCRVRDNDRSGVAQSFSTEATWELPDGNLVRMSEEKFQAAEDTLFSDLPHVSNGTDSEVRLSYVQQMAKNVGSNGAPASGQHVITSKGVDGMVVDAIRMCDQSTHRDMYAGVCLTGGTAHMNGLYERISAGLAETYHKVRVLAATGAMERKYCSWTGGSILGTFSEFQRLWISKKDYEESGSSFVHRRDP